MKRTIRVLLGLSLMSTAAYAADKKADELTDPMEILKKVDAASKAVKTVKYTGSLKGAGAAESHMPDVEGTVVMSGWSRGTPEKCRCDAKVKRPGSSEVTSISVGSDGETFFLVDHKAKKAYVGINPAVVGSTGRPVLALRMLEFVHPTPFKDEINGDKQELKGSRKIGGEDCYEIHVVYAGSVGEAIWYFSKKDFLPRGVERILRTPSGESASQRWELTDVVVDPKFDKDPFKLDLPEGYTKTDDFAP